MICRRYIISNNGVFIEVCDPRDGEHGQRATLYAKVEDLY